MKEDAFIFDIDGTLAIKGDRSPYNWEKVGIDTLNQSVARVLRSLWRNGCRIIIFTGRDGSCSDLTKKWLANNNIPYDHFDIRPEGDNRKDSIVKKEMYDKIKSKYTIIGVFDDRDQVVKMWRDLGLQCYQVNYGDF